jgi:tight adherence protein C
MILLLIIGLLLFGTGVVLVLQARISSSGTGTVETLEQIESAYGFAPKTSTEPGDGAQRPVMAVARLLGTGAQRLLGSGEKGIQAQLLAAGMYDVEPATIVGYRILTALGTAILAAWVGVSRGFSVPALVLVAVAVGAAGWMLPMTYLSRRARHRVDRIEYELPELIDLLVVTLEAGLSFLASLHLAADRLEGPLGDELRLALHQQRMGLTPNDALQGMLRRADTPMLRTFVRSVSQGEQLGVSTGQIMRNLALEMRKKRRAKAEERAQKAPIKMLFPLIFLIFPAMFVVLLGPAAYTISNVLGD